MIKRFCRFSSALHEDGSYHKIFCDYVKLFARGGTGGAGAALFLSLYRNEFAHISNYRPILVKKTFALYFLKNLKNIFFGNQSV